jgi:putative inorganic carbon (HCO3(-)) transporter
MYGRPTLRTPMDFPILCLLLMAAISTWASALPDVSLPKLLGIILGVAFFYGVVNSTKSARAVWAWAGLVVILGVGISCLALVGTNWSTRKLLLLGPIYERLPRLVHNVPGSLHGGFHPNEVGGALALLLPLSLATCLALWVSNPGIAAGLTHGMHSGRSQAPMRPWARILLSRRTLLVVASLCLTLITGVVVLTQSRSAFLGLAVGLIVLGSARIRWAGLLLPLLVLLGLALGSALGGQNLLNALLMLDVTGTAAGRFEIWERAVYMIQDFPYTGIGLNSFPQVGDAMYPYFLLGPDAKVPHAHNNLLQVAVDLGIPGLVAYVGLLSIFCLCAWRVYRRSRSHPIRLLTAGLFSGMIAHQVYGLTDAITLGAKPGFMMWIIIGLVAALYSLEVRPGSLPNSAQAGRHV